MSGTMIAPDGRPRCHWCAIGPDMLAYHDREWGFPVGDDRLLFEKFCLEGFQSGLSWRTILTKRENFRAAFHGFDIARVAAMTDADIGRLLQNEGIIRNRAKIAAAINNAKRAQDLIGEVGSLAAYVWRFEPAAENLPPPQTITTSPESIALSKDLKKRGWAFVGPTTVFAMMQALGLVNDHAHGCVTRDAVAAARAGFRLPALSRVEKSP
ncbi:DNA-3-methyladenine glycosylase I [Acidisoma cellulosilytica]|uniref:DNA-3-methyladenine glycosylase I n=1 Tax=Acidisoma cellulosilyticum TaxID=2802395 RepID=A0A963Z308_9PROT|nr:DNA-3-methyladenine glycosylase I [Acidisoma cellulosilyticum]MCB8881917.1 DNA-3-methyladenine glycosylase I [Acidisoma cellulosilyticum]